jgi:adenosine kinase
MSVLVTGSLAIDHIMVFPDRFRNHILPDRLHVLNVAFHVPSLHRHFGGTAGNIAYYLRLLGEDPIVLAAAGDDFAPYAEWLDRHGVRRDRIRIVEDRHTAQAFITTDLDDNQITAFHPGAMEQAHQARLEDVAEAFRIAIVAPNGKRAMQEYARALKERGIPAVVDPGQQLPVFEPKELLELLDGAAIYIVNDYEWSVTLERSGLDEEALCRRVGAVVVTRGAQGSTVRQDERKLEIPAVPAERVVDPTGCGDAYRAGLLCGWLRGWPLEQAARLGSLLGSLVVGVSGTQSLDIDLGIVRERYKREFGSSF